ncbi:portal protein [Paraburkholderia sediminicola]|uniref:portal protein n=1 Tax=Paraburkholderia sediminicola TaxID=458836 RepID=UPI0038BD64C5
MAKPMSDDELLALIGQYERSSLGSSVAVGPSVGGNIKPAGQTMTTLEIDRYNALNAYFGRPMGNEVEDRSQIVLPELRDTVEWIMPTLMRMFVGAGKPVQFDPEAPGDEDQSEQETEVVNHVFMKQNPGFFILHDMFKDALLLRNGYVSSYWVKKTKTSVESYTGLNEIEVTELLQTDDEIEVMEQDEQTQLLVTPAGPQPITVFDIKIRRTSKKGCVKVECVPPEEMRVSPQARHGLDESPFTQHMRSMSRSDAKELGFDADMIDAITVARPEWLDLISLARNEVTDQLSEENPSDPASQMIDIRTNYIRVDRDGDGISEFRRVVVGGDKILEDEEIEEGSFSYCSPIRMPHRHVGISYYDLLNDLQVIKTTLFRQALDNIYISNNQRTAVNWRTVNVQDLLVSRPGGIVRVDGPVSDNIVPFQQPSNLMQQILPAMEYCDLQREMRTGIGKDTMGVDGDALQDVTKGGQLAAMSAAAAKVELVARLLAEGVKDIFQKIHNLLRRHQDEQMTIMLTNRQWLTSNPAEWRERSELVVNVGLGSGNREEARANVMLLGQAQKELAPFGLVGPKQAYNTFRKVSHLLGFENPTEFAMDPDSQEYQQAQAQKQHQPPDPHVQVAQIRASTDIQKAQLGAQTDNMKMQSEQRIEAARSQADMVRAQADTTQAQAELVHGAQQGAQDRDAQMAQINSQEWQTVVKIIGQIVASQLKQNAAADAGQMVNHDVSEVQRGA